MEKTCEALGMTQLSDDKRFCTGRRRVEHRRELISVLERRVKCKNADYWLDRLDSIGVPCSPISTIKEALESNHTISRNLIEVMNHKKLGKLKSVGCPIHVNDFGNRFREKIKPPPLLGEDSLEILKKFGYSSSQIRMFCESGIVRKSKIGEN